MLCLNDKYDTLDVCLNMKLLGAVVDIHQKQVVQKQILNEVILIKTLLISNQKTLNLEGGKFANHIYVVTASLGKKNIF